MKSDGADSLFGLLLKEKRLQANISQWNFCRRLDYHIRNLQRIESGIQEPRLDSALNMVKVLDMRCGEFFGELAARSVFQFKTQGIVPSSLHNITSSDVSPSVAAQYGDLLRAVREYFHLSQVNLSEKAGYCLRSITKLENGVQTPRITSALKLVYATGCDIKWFFDTLENHIR